MRVVYEAIEDGISDCRVADYVMPVVSVKLACNQGRAAVISFFDDFKQVAPLLVGERSESEIVN
jgi:hypothetical protein